MNNIQNISPFEAHAKLDEMFIRAGYLMRVAEENERDLEILERSRQAPADQQAVNSKGKEK